MAEVIKGYSLRYANYAAVQSGTAITTTPGFLGSVIVNKTPASDAVLTIKDGGSSGTVLATITAPTIGMVFPFNCAITKSLYITLSATTNYGDFTITYDTRV